MLNSLVGIIASSGGATVSGDYESISSITVGSGGASSVTFSSIPSTYKHLQIRAFARTNRPTYNIDGLRLRFNSDTGSNYSSHNLIGDPTTSGSSASAGGAASATNILLGQFGTTASTGIFGVGIIDLIDYASTTKNKTLRSLAGVETNGGAAGYSGYTGFYSGAWYNTSAISSINIYSDSASTIQQFSTFALYGIKGA